jgi:hypothetical protein
MAAPSACEIAEEHTYSYRNSHGTRSLTVRWSDLLTVGNKTFFTLKPWMPGFVMFLTEGYIDEDDLPWPCTAAKAPGLVNIKELRNKQQIELLLSGGVEDTREKNKALDEMLGDPSAAASDDAGKRKGQPRRGAAQSNFPYAKARTAAKGWMVLSLAGGGSLRVVRPVDPRESVCIEHTNESISAFLHYVRNVACFTADDFIPKERAESVKPMGRPRKIE